MPADAQGQLRKNQTGCRIRATLTANRGTFTIAQPAVVSVYEKDAAGNFSPIAGLQDLPVTWQTIGAAQSVEMIYNADGTDNRYVVGVFYRFLFQAWVTSSYDGGSAREPCEIEVECQPAVGY